MIDATYTELPDEIILHPGSVNGAQWIVRYITTNVTDIHYTDKSLALKHIEAMRKDGLKVHRARRY
jgi:hypothetical protein